MKSTLYLASTSPRRHELLNQIDLEHIVLKVPSPPGEDEPRLLTESPFEYVQRTAYEKALRAQDWLLNQDIVGSKQNQSLGILTADTTVALGDLVLGKPSDEKEASEILSLLSGKTHTVYTALVLSKIIINTPSLKLPKEKTEKWRQWRSLSMTKVSFCELTRQDIEQYIASREPFGKAGAYGIQGKAAQFIKRIEGSYSGVMGLPLYETSELIKNL
jgi:septum formation protein